MFRCARLPLVLHTTRVSTRCRAKPWRPDLDDVERLSKGGSCKRRGTGNFNIPHRLNSEERPLFDGAKKKGFLVVKNSGYRKARKGYPLPNAWRQWCDAKGKACVVVEQPIGAGGLDILVVDLTPLRLLDNSQAAAAVCDAAQAAGARQLLPPERSTEDVPFNIIPEAAAAQATASPAAPAAAQPPTQEELAVLDAAVSAQADEVRGLKAAGYTNQSPEVQFHVQELKRLKQQLQQAQEAVIAAAGAGAEHLHGSDQSDGSAAAEAAASSAGSSGSASRRQDALDDDHPLATLAIWQLPAIPLFFEAPRPVAKALAKGLSDMDLQDTQMQSNPVEVLAAV